MWLLLGCYALATLWPAARPGHAAMGVVARHDWPIVPLSLPLLLLAVMLFIAALLTDVRADSIRPASNPLLLCLALAAVWLGPALLVVAAGWSCPGSSTARQPPACLVGLALVATMPVANSSVGWTQNAAGNLALGLRTGRAQHLAQPLGHAHICSACSACRCRPTNRRTAKQLVNQFLRSVLHRLGGLLPTAAGFACRYFADAAARDAQSQNWLTLASAAALLVLNYINSALALPKIRDSPPSLLATTADSGRGAERRRPGACGWAIAPGCDCPADTRSALMFGLSMKHTGLALILAGAVLADQPLAILMIVLATLTAALAGRIVQWWLRSRAVQ